MELETSVYSIFDSGVGETGRGSTAAHQTLETGMMEQYRRIKERYRDALLFFRFGDFYEMFYDDAKVASRALDIVLTSRPQGKNGERVPMCGVPHHRLESYLARLIERGHKVAICEQLEGPSKGKGLIQRDVIRVITPGTFFDSEGQEGVLATLLSEGEHIGIAFLRLATGEFLLLETTREQLPGVLARFRPQEILLKAGERLEALPHYHPLVAERSAETFVPEQALAPLASHFGRVTIEPLGISAPRALVAAGVLLAYVKETQMAFLPHLQAPKLDESDSVVFLDAQTQRNLELIENIFQGTEEGTLFSILDHTRTSMGRRRLKRWLLHPMRSVARIHERQGSVAELVSMHCLRARLQEALAGILDLERLTSRMTSAIANPRDLVALRAALAPLPRIRDLLVSAQAPLLHALYREFDTLEDVHAEIQRVLVDESRATAREGEIIRPGVCAELDELHAIERDSTGWLASYEHEQRERTGILNLKVGFNKVFGYYIEVTKSNLRAVPPDYQRRQTLVNAERFITEEIKQFEQKTLSATERAKEIEYALFVQLRDNVAAHAARLRQTADVLGTLDGLASLAEVAACKGWVRPEVTDGYRIAITEGRHPIVELLTGEFVPNDLHLDESQSFLILTGPNAAGKSTYVRQAAILVLLAQIGSFVPAEKAHISVVDRIFIRAGAADFLARGLSTFMMEMMETAKILRHATHRSLVILDEVGRGTGASDGQAIAQAVVEILAQEIKAKTLFTTHYHLLAGLAHRIPGMVNARLAVHEDRDEVTFLYKVVPGAAQKSYGIYVAKLAGLPASVVQRAGELLAELEQEQSATLSDGVGPGPEAVGTSQSFGGPRLEKLSEKCRERASAGGARSAGTGAYTAVCEDSEHRANSDHARAAAFQIVSETLVMRLLQIEPLHTTPIEALELLAELKQLVLGTTAGV